jgi:hypothetical protein
MAPLFVDSAKCVLLQAIAWKFCVEDDWGQYNRPIILLIPPSSPSSDFSLVDTPFA